MNHSSQYKYPSPELRFSHILNCWTVYTFINKSESHIRKWYKISSEQAREFSQYCGAYIHV